MKTIAYSATRQWNPGDEFILFGTINLLNACVGRHNAVIYNRHPDIHQLCGEGKFREYKLPVDHPAKGNLLWMDTDLRLGFNDNSIKFDSRLDYVDYAIIAGSPECFNQRMYNFYEHVYRNNLPIMILGLGHVDQEINPKIQKILQHASLITVRSPDLVELLSQRGLECKYLPCPALYANALGKEKIIDEVRKIALVFCVSSLNTVISHNVADNTYEYICSLYENLLKKYAGQYEFAIICHYIDELPIAHDIFDRYNVPVLYSFDAKDYIDTYRDFDLAVSPRVHGCGVCASLGIPSINISHDFRAKTSEGFLAQQIISNTSFEKVFAIIESSVKNIKHLNRMLIKHKHVNFEQTKQLIIEALKVSVPNYDECRMPIDNNQRVIKEPSEIANFLLFDKNDTASFILIDRQRPLDIDKLLLFVGIKNAVVFYLKNYIKKISIKLLDFCNVKNNYT